MGIGFNAQQAKVDKRSFSAALLCVCLLRICMVGELEGVLWKHFFCSILAAHDGVVVVVVVTTDV